ncbi:acyclic terpene utilization AtuA family protein [Ramlibacter sp.]|uniref:acyclic terpene utilization AtuA family protein n=1 Tax=Ramlibacter sp. TaxID=1917967 RepID=UPI003D12E184
MATSAKSKDTLRIGGACAFWGDTNAGVTQLVKGGDCDVLVFDYLAELTMSLLHKARSRDPEAGFASDFVTAVTPVLGEIASKGIKLLSNAGAMNPQACARALRKACDAAGVSLRIAVVEGDDLMPVREQIAAAGVKEMFSGQPLPQNMTSMNAYLGAMPIAAALARGADVVITGRCVDSALSLAALVHRFGWKPDEYDRLAAGSLVGHILECTTQTTGGLFTDWWRVPGWDNMGFPVAECSADGSFVLEKPAGTGGLIAPEVVTEQMLYEVGDPANYLLPDVTCDLSAVRMTQVGENRVRVEGARGRPPTDTYKVSSTWSDGFRLSTTLTIVGDDAAPRADRVAEALLSRTRRMMAEAGFADYSETHVEVLGSETPSYGAHQSGGTGSREVVLRIALRHTNAAALDIAAKEVAPFGVSSAAGTTGFSGRPKAGPVFRLFSFAWPKDKVPVSVTIDGESKPVEIPRGVPIAQSIGDGQRYGAAATAALPAGERITVPLSAIAVARSGDKGDISNIAIIARDPKFVPVIAQQLPTDVVKAHFRHLVKGKVTRYDVPGVHAFNYVMEQALGGGGAGSLRNDPLGKSLGQVLLATKVEIPAAWQSDISAGPPRK